MNESDYRLISEHTSDVVLRITYLREQHLLRANYVSPSSSRVLGWAPEEMVGKGPEHFVAPDDLPTVMSAANRTLAGEQDIRVVYRMRRRSGDYLWVEHINRLIIDPVTRRPGDFIIAMRDVTERRRLEDQLVAIASTDGLTGLANRRKFDQRLLDIWHSLASERSALSVLLIDLDHFKGFNDRYGHLAGDDCLRHVATGIAKSVEMPGSLVARYGGEEFAAILPAADASGALKVATGVRNAVEALAIPHASNEGGQGLVTISLGAATTLFQTSEGAAAPRLLLAAADTALYRAKRAGRNRVETESLLISASAAKSAA